MDFFQAQERARRRTGLLLLLFIAGVAGMVIVLYGFLSILLGHGGDYPLPADVPVVAGFPLNTALLLDTTVGVLALVSVGTIYKALTLLSGSGQKIAAAMGGRLILPDSRVAEERRLLNIISEMAIAAGAPLPDVYLLPDEHINAFAAGTTPHNAVIGVTRGALRQLNRAQLQGVMAHEFSHIMNGDMRLNIRLLAVIHGIMLLGYLGYFILRSSYWGGLGRSSRGGANWLPLVGIGLIAAGFLGTVFGSCIRAAVSRQREYLADAAAVQYTRQPEGIAGALERIWQLSAVPARPPKQTAALASSAAADSGGENNHIVEYAHMLFSEPQLSAFSNPFASHPPLPDRIRRILPGWTADDAVTDAPLPVSDSSSRTTASLSPAVSALSGTAPAASPAAAPAAPAASSEVAAKIGNINAASLNRAAAVLQSIPAALRTATENSYSARALIYLLLLDKNDTVVRQRQIAHIADHADTGVYDLMLKLAEADAQLPQIARLPLVQCTLPALRLLSPPQYHRFLQNIEVLVNLDSAIELFEWCLQAIIVHDLYDHFNGKRRSYGEYDKREAINYALSLLARVGQSDPANAVAAAAAAAALPLTYSEAAFQPQQLFDAMQTIGTLPPKKKAGFIHAAVSCAEFNGKIDDNEATLLRAYFMLLDCPLPLALTDAGEA